MSNLSSLSSQAFSAGYSCAFAVLVVCCQYYDARCGAAIYELHGKVTATEPGGERDFSVFCAGEGFLIRVSSGKPGDTNYYYEASSPDGKVYYMAYISLKVNMTGVCVDSNAIPIGCNDVVSSFLWVPFASSGFFARHTQAVLKPFFNPITAVSLDNDWRVPARWEMADTEPRLPRWVAYFNEGSHRLWYPSNRQAVLKPYHKPYDKGFTNALMAVTAWTNVGELTLPQSAVFYEFKPAQGGRTNTSLAVQRKVEMQVHTALDRCSLTNFMPHAEKSTVVIDSRLVRNNPKQEKVTYDLKHDKWLSPDELRALVAQRQERKQKKEESPPVLLVVGFCALLALPLAWPVWRGIRNRRQP